MIKNLKIKTTFYNIYTGLTIFLLIVYANTDNLLDTNLSRISNNNLKGYLFLNFWSLMFGFSSFLLLRKMNEIRLSYLGLFSAVIGSLTPYNYLNVNAFTSNLHLTLAYVSFGVVTLIEIYVLNKFKIYGLKQENNLRNIYIIVFGICLYLFLDRGYVCTLCEMLYLLVILVSWIYIYNRIEV